MCSSSVFGILLSSSNTQYEHMFGVRNIYQWREPWESLRRMKHYQCIKNQNTCVEVQTTNKVKTCVFECFIVGYPLLINIIAWIWVNCMSRRYSHMNFIKTEPPDLCSHYIQLVENKILQKLYTLHIMNIEITCTFLNNSSPLSSN